MGTELPQRTMTNCRDSNTLRGCVTRDLRLGRRVFCEHRSHKQGEPRGHFGGMQYHCSSRSSQPRNAAGADKHDRKPRLEAFQRLNFHKQFVFQIVTIDDRTIRPPMGEKQLKGHVRGVQVATSSQPSNSAAAVLVNALEPSKRLSLCLFIRGTYVVYSRD
jgi:hypothetical protein